MTIGISRVHYCKVWRGVPTFKSMPYVETLTRKYSTWTLHILSFHYQKTRDITWNIFFYFTALMNSSETNHIN